MNSEELEQSLRTEFESYLKNVLADMRQDVADFQKQFEAEFEKHKAQIDEVFQNLLTRVDADREFDTSFTESVVEHLRLSRDEGARITAMAIAEAEELEKQKAARAVSEKPAAPAFSFSEIRDAINDISTKTTQSTILKTLVQHASQFTPRGAFFIIKNEHFVGWRMFGQDGETVDEQTVREVFFPVASSTVLGESVRSLSAVESAYGVYSDDSIYLNKLNFDQPEQMFAVPLVVRGRSVAVLYADRGANGGEVNIDALEALVRVASMTVEILASSRGAQAQTETAEAASVNNGFEQPVQADSRADETVEQTAPAMEKSYQFAETSAQMTEERNESDHSYAPAVEEGYSYQPIEQPAASFETTNYQTSYESDGFSFKPSEETQEAPAEFVSQIPEDATVERESAPTFEAEPAWRQTDKTEDFYQKEPSVSYEIPSSETEGPVYEISEPQAFETGTAVAENEYAPSFNGSSDYQYETNQSFEASPAGFEATAPQAFETPQYEAPSSSYEAPQYEAENFAPTNGAAATAEATVTENGKAESYASEASVETVAAESVVIQPARSRFSERNVDLPIEVSEEERRHHNDARRFARLLVSEIKLYNEQKVREGREGNDLYERLREAIDRSREMYDKRVTPSVAAKFDYFHYELVSNLAEGDDSKLGASYPVSGV